MRKLTRDKFKGQTALGNSGEGEVISARAAGVQNGLNLASEMLFSSINAVIEGEEFGEREKRIHFEPVYA